MSSKIGRNVRSELGLVKGYKITNPESFEAVGLQKTPNGYVVVKLHIENGNIVSVKETDPEPHALATERLKMETIRIIQQ